MKKNSIWLALLVSSLSLMGCSQKTDVPLDSDAYVKTLAWKEGFKVLQLTDIHWNFTTDIPAEKAFLKATINKAAPDLLMITGDSTLDANEEIVTTLYDFINSFNIPFAVTFGNHDRQGTFSHAWLRNLLLNESNSLYTEIADSLTGNSNYVIDLSTSENKIAWQLFLVDSNSYSYTGFDVKYTYDYIHQDQVDWYAAQAERSKLVDGAYAPSAFYFHIPLWEWYYAYEKNPQGDLGEIHEKSTYSVPALTKEPIKFWVGNSPSALFNEAVARNGKAFYCGHDHSNDWGSYYTNGDGLKGFVSYGVKSGRELYYAQNDAGRDITGGSLMTLHADQSWELSHIYVNSDNLQDIEVRSLPHA
jgi:hypothetical protein